MNLDPKLTAAGIIKVTRSLGIGFLLVAALATQASSQTILIDDFSDGHADGWTTIDSTVGQHYGPGVFDASSEAYHLETAGLVPVGVPGGGFLASTWDRSSDPMFHDGFLRARVRAEHEGVYASLALRLSGSLETGFNGYLFGGSTGPTPGFFFNTVAGSQSVESIRLDPSFAFGVNEDWNIEAGAVGDEISMKVWRVGQPEPDTPQLMLTDNSFSTGSVGVEANVNTTPFPHPAHVGATFDDISFTVANPDDGAGLWTGTWMSPMPIPQTLLPPSYPRSSADKTDLRGDATAPEGWPELRITGRVTDLDGQPIPGLKLDFFHTDVEGAFGTDDSSTLRGHQFTDSEGNYELWTITPGQFKTLRTRLLHFFVGGENQGYESPVYRTEMFFPDPFDNDINADGAPDKVYVDGLLTDEDAIGIENDFFVPGALSEAGAEFSDLASNILTVNNDPLIDGYFDTTLNIVMPSVFQAPLLGDYNGDRQLDASDLELQAAGIQINDAAFDLDGDGDADVDDRFIWVRDLKGTWIGDANLDGEFSSSDLITVFQAAKYELDVDAGWAEGDWTGDLRFGSSDLIAAFQDGGYELGTRAAVSAVPEPTSILMLMVGLFGIGVHTRRTRR